MTGQQRIVRLHSHVLQDQAVRASYTDQGFHWIRRAPQPFHEILRNPTIGWTVELSSRPLANAVKLSSRAAQVLINSQC